MAIDTKFSELEPSMWKAFDRKYISFPLIYRFAGIRRVLAEVEADN